MNKIMFLLLPLSLMFLIAGCQSIVCKEPYMRFEAGCCLDKNGNGICDEDDTGEDAAEKVSFDQLNQLKDVMNLSKTVEVEKTACKEVQVPYTEEVNDGTTTACHMELARYETTEQNCTTILAEPIHPVCGSKDFHQAAFKVKNTGEEDAVFGFDLGAWVNNIRYKFNNETINISIDAGDEKTLAADFCNDGLRGVCWIDAIYVPSAEICETVNKTTTVTKYRTETQCE